MAEMGTAAKLIEIAKAEIGTVEGPKDNETKYGAYTKANFVANKIVPSVIPNINFISNIIRNFVRSYIRYTTNRWTIRKCSPTIIRITHLIIEMDISSKSIIK